MWVWTVVTINDTSLLPTSRNQPREHAQYFDCVIISTVVNKQSFLLYLCLILLLSIEFKIRTLNGAPCQG